LEELLKGAAITANGTNEVCWHV